MTTFVNELTNEDSRFLTGIGNWVPHFPNFPYDADIARVTSPSPHSGVGGALELAPLGGSTSFVNIAAFTDPYVAAYTGGVAGNNTSYVEMYVQSNSIGYTGTGWFIFSRATGAGGGGGVANLTTVDMTTSWQQIIVPIPTPGFSVSPPVAVGFQCYSSDLSTPPDLTFRAYVSNVRLMIEGTPVAPVTGLRVRQRPDNLFTGSPRLRAVSNTPQRSGSTHRVGHHENPR